MMCLPDHRGSVHRPQVAAQVVCRPPGSQLPGCPGCVYAASPRMELVADLTLVLLAALAGGFLAQLLGQPLIVGYIVAGIAVGPFSAGPTVGNVREIEQLAELGVVLLLFSLGL